MRTKERQAAAVAEVVEAAGRAERPEYAVAETDPTSHAALVPALPAGLAAVPADQLDGMDEFGALRNWVSFDAQRGLFTCKALNREYAEFTGVVIASQVVRVLKDEDGNVQCASFDRVSANTGRPGKVCAVCEDRERCGLRWWVCWHDQATGELFAHTLSQTGSLNFQRYARLLLQEQLLPSQVLTRIYVEEARRLKTNTVYRRVQFARLDAESIFPLAS